MMRADVRRVGQIILQCLPEGSVAMGPQPWTPAGSSTPRPPTLAHSWSPESGTRFPNISLRLLQLPLDLSCNFAVFLLDVGIAVTLLTSHHLHETLQLLSKL